MAWHKGVRPYLRNVRYLLEAFEEDEEFPALQDAIECLLDLQKQLEDVIPPPAEPSDQEGKTN